MKKTKKPAIRFEGFAADWEKHKLSDIAKRVTRKNTDLQSTLPLTISSQYGLVDQITYFNNRIASQNISGYYLIKNGEFAYNKSSSDGFPFGTVKRLDRYDMGVLSTLYIIFALKDDSVSSQFLVSYYDTDYWHKQVSERAAEGARNHGLLNISADDFLDTELLVPSEVEEQDAVASYLKTLDTLITNAQQKYDKILTFKKSMLEKLFPQNGAKVPEVRFAGFDGEWEKCKFRDLYEPVTQKNDLTYGINENITVASMQYKTNIKVTDEDYLRTYNVFLLGDIAFEGHHSKEFRYGRFVENDIGNGIVSHIFTVFRPICEYDLSYWKYAINNEKLMRPILSCCTKASTMMNDLVAKDFLDSCIRVPTIDEQKKIGAFLKSLDELVSLYGAELEKLKNIKSALLEKMFV